MFELVWPDEDVPVTDRRAGGFFSCSGDRSGEPLGPSSLVVAVIVSPDWCIRGVTPRGRIRR
jgi:hypothetical protein